MLNYAKGPDSTDKWEDEESRTHCAAQKKRRLGQDRGAGDGLQSARENFCEAD